MSLLRITIRINDAAALRQSDIGISVDSAVDIAKESADTILLEKDTECKDFIGLGALYKLGKWHLGVFKDYANFRERNEFAIELTCKIPISEHIEIQPTVHLITYDSKLHGIGMLRMAISL